MFIAVDLPPAARAAVAAARDAWSRKEPRARWIPTENLHVTMKFLGAVPDEEVPDLSAAISDALTGHVDIVVTLGVAGAFPSPGRARVLWVGIDDPAGGLRAIAAAVDEQVETLGHAREERVFRPHVTVARMPVPGRVDPRVVPVEPVRFPVDRLTLFQSHLGGNKPARYEAVTTYPFRRPLSPPRDEGEA